MYNGDKHSMAKKKYKQGQVQYGAGLFQKRKYHEEKTYAFTHPDAKLSSFAVEQALSPYLTTLLFSLILFSNLEPGAASNTPHTTTAENTANPSPLLTEQTTNSTVI